MHTRQPTALKCKLKQIKEGKMVSEGNNDLVEINGRRVGRVNVIGTITHKYENRERMFTFANLDDGTAVMSLRVFKEGTKFLEDVKVGDIVNAVASVREYEDKKYLSPLTVKKVTNPNKWLLRKIRLNQKSGVKKTSKSKESTPEKSKEKVLKVMKEYSDEGIVFDHLIEETGLERGEVENVVNELLEKGEAFEPKPNTLKILD